ncbi:MAG: hypothetical protein WCI22_02155, partial [Actinomycetota bacterium]
MERQLALMTAATGAITFGLGTVCLATVGGVNLFGMGKAEPVHAIAIVDSSTTLGAPSDTVVVTTAPGVPVTDAAGTPVTDPAGVVVTTPAPTTSATPPGAGSDFSGAPGWLSPGTPSYTTAPGTTRPGT